MGKVSTKKITNSEIPQKDSGDRCDLHCQGAAFIWKQHVGAGVEVLGKGLLSSALGQQHGQCLGSQPLSP